MKESSISQLNKSLIERFKTMKIHSFKNNLSVVILTIIISLVGNINILSQTENVGIGTTSPDNSSILDLYSTVKGFLAPRMTTVQRDAIASAANGLFIYNTTIGRFQFNEGTVATPNWLTIATPSDAGNVYGSGVNGQVAYWNTSSTITGTNNFFWDNSTTRLGIGDNTPDHSLDVAGNIGMDANGYINYGDTDGLTGYGFRDNSGTIEFKNSGGNWNIFGSGNGDVFGTGANGQVAFWNSSNTITGVNNLFWDNATSRLGIGDITPDHSLDIAGNIGMDAGGYINYGDTDGLTGYGLRDNLGNLEFKNSGGSWQPLGAGGGDVYGSGANGQIAFWNSSNTITGVNNLFWDNATSRLGIGDITPDHSLDIAGNVGMDAGGYINYGDTDGLTGYGLRDNAGTIEYKNSGGAWQAFGSASGDVSGSGANGQIAFWNSSNTITGSNNLFWDNSNNIMGIGTSTPSSSVSLHVLGNARIQGMLEINGSTIIQGNLQVTGEIDPISITLQPQGSAPSSVRGKVYYDNTDNELKVFDGSSWIALDLWSETAGNVYRSSGSVGLGRAAPRERLDIQDASGDGAIIVGNTSTSFSGAIRWTGFDFEGYDGTDYISLTTGGSGGGSSTITGSGAAGQVTVWSGASTLTGNNNLYWNNVASRLGIQDNTPDHSLDVAGNIGMDAGGYLNFGDTDGSTGYGIRDNTGTIEYKNSAGSWQGFAGGTTLDGAYDQGGAGVGRTITVDNGAVQLTGSNVAAYSLEVTNSANGGVIYVNNNGTGNTLYLDDFSGSYPVVVDANGNVGIGITGTINAQLDIKANDANAIRIQPYNTGGGNTGRLEFMELLANGVDYVSFKAPDMIAANVIWTLPNADGTAGQLLTTDGSGNLSWASAAGGGNTLDQAYDEGGAGVGRTLIVDNSAVQFTGSNAADETIEVTNSGNGGVALFENTGTGLSLRVNDEAADATPFVIDEVGEVGIGTISPTYPLEVVGAIRTGADGTSGELRIYSEQGATDYEVVLRTHAAMTATTTYLLPAGDGTNGQNLATDGSGNLSWASAAGGGDVYGTGAAGQVAFWNSSNTITGANNFFWDNATSRLGIIDNTPDHTLDVEGNIGIIAGGYINYGDTDGATGYGLRDNIGTIEFKNSAGSWQPISAGNTLDEAYDQGGAGVGKGIAVDTGPVGLYGSNSGTYTLEVTNSANGGVIFVDNNGTGNTLYLDDFSGSYPVIVDANGNVGIGITGSINAQLHVKANDANAIRIEAYNTGAGNTGRLQFMELLANGVDYVSFRAPDMIAANVIWTLPSADGATGEVLSTDGSGILSWSSVGGGNTLDAAYDQGGAGVGKGIAVDTGPVGLYGSNSGTYTLEVFNTANGGTVLIENAGTGLSLRVNDIAADTSPFVIDEVGDVGIGVLSPTAQLEITSDDANALRINPYGIGVGAAGELQFMELAAAGTNYVGFKAADALAASVIWVLPIADGTVGQTLATDGSGNLSWASAGGVTLDGAYDYGGVGIGRTIIVDNSAVQFTGSNAADETIEVTNSGNGGVALFENTGTGLSLRVNDIAADTSPFVIDEVGDVGIGVLSPIAQLEITSDDANALRINPYGIGLGATSELQFMELTAAGTDYVGFKAADALAASVVWVLPIADGTIGQTLATDGSGNLSWASAGGVTLDGAYDYGGAGIGRTIIVDNSAVQFIGSNAADETIEVTNLGNGGVALFENTGTGLSLRVNDEALDASPFVIDEVGDVGIGVISPTAQLEITSDDANALRINPYGIGAGASGELQFMELVAAGTNYVGFKAADALAGNVVWVLPIADGTVGQTLATDGAGNLSWASPAGGGNTLDQAYDQGGAGLGRTIIVDNSAVQFTGSNAADETIEVTNSGNGGVALFENTGTGTSLRVNDVISDTSPFIITDAGDVGVGLVAPLDKVHVEGAVLREGWFMGYRTSAQADGGGAATVNWNGEIREDASYYTHTGSNDNIIILQTGWYRISYAINIQYTDGNDNRTTYRVWVEDDGTPINGSYSYTYIRRTGQHNNRGTTSNSFITQITANSDIIVNVLSSRGGDNYDIMTNSQITIERIDQ